MLLSHSQSASDNGMSSRYCAFKMEMLQAICGVIIVVIVGRANMSPVNQTNSFQSNITHDVISVQNNNTYNKNGDDRTNSDDYSAIVSENVNNTIFNSLIYKTATNISKNIKDRVDSEVPSVFELASYNNTCSRRPEQKTCFIQQNKTAEEEAELCRQYMNIVHLAYVFSCYYNVPSDQLTNASSYYIKSLTAFLSMHEPLRKYYIQSMLDAEKLARAVVMSDIQALQGVKAYSLPHSPSYTFNLYPIQIPVLYEEHKTYVLQLGEYVNQTSNVSDYIRENNLTNIFPYLYEILLNITQKEEAHLREDLSTLEKLWYLFDNYNKFIEGYRIFDIAVLGSAGILFSIGIVLNSILLAVFVRFREIITYATAPLINLIIVDYISLVFNLLVYYVIDRIFYLQTSCTALSILIVIRHLSYVVSIYSLVIISFQRYQAVSQPFRCRLGDKAKTVIMTCGVWVFGMLYSLPNFVFVEYDNGDCKYNVGKYGKIILNIQFCVLCIVPIVIVTIFSIMTSYKLRKSISSMPGERIGLEKRIKQRTVSSRIVLSFIFLILISYVPSHVASYVFFYSADDNLEITIFRTPTVSQYVNAITYNFMHFSSCFNPLVLYFLSSKFKKYIHEIICVCKSQQTQNPKSKTNNTAL